MSVFKFLLSRKNNKIRKPYGYDLSGAIQDFHQNAENIILEWKNYESQNSNSILPIDEISVLQKELNLDKKWKAYFLFAGREYNVVAKTHFPITTQLIQKWKKDLNLVFFSNLEPGKHLQAHHGNNHGVIRTQIGIDIKDSEKTGLRVEDKVVQLKNKEIFTFDDTFEHEAWNNSEYNRVVLIIDTYKEFPTLYDLINKCEVKKINKTKHVRSAIEKMNKQK